MSEQQRQQPFRGHGGQCKAPAPAATATTTPDCVFSPAHDLSMENVINGIYLTKNFLVWNEGNLRKHGFTHIIIIDKHIKTLFYPAEVFKFLTDSHSTAHIDAFDSFEYYSQQACTPLSFSKEFEAIDLNFGEKSYLTTVLPNCYRAVEFIDKALQSGGRILIIDCNGGEQKCLTVIVAYLMYKHDISFINAFTRLKESYKNADLDRFYMNQLYEYEPILKVQRAESHGHSCSRRLRSAKLKRKKIEEIEDKWEPTNDVGSKLVLFNAFNPLSNFNAAQREQGVQMEQPTSTMTDALKVEQPEQHEPLLVLNGWDDDDDVME